MEVVATTVSGGATWVDVDARGTRNGLELAACLAPYGIELPDLLLTDLVSEDTIPELREVKGVRKVSAFATRDDYGDSLRAIEIELVEIVQSQQWIVSCWNGDVPESESIRPRVLANVGAMPLASPGDVGIGLLNELTMTLRDARRAIHRRLEHWEMDYYTSGRADPSTLVELRKQLYAITRRLHVLDVRRTAAVDGWFTTVTDAVDAQRIDDRIDRFRAQFDQLGAHLRTAFELARFEQSEQLAKTVEVVTAVLLVPTLVVGFYGANTWLPGRGNVYGLGLMLALMVAAGATTYRFLHRRSARNALRRRGWRSTRIRA